MTVDEMLQATAAGTGLPGAPNLYTGSALEFLIWNYTAQPDVFANGAPHAARYQVQMHYFLPTGKNPKPIRRALSFALFKAGCTWPTVTNANDDEGQHYVLECEYTDGGDYYGEP